MDAKIIPFRRPSRERLTGGKGDRFRTERAQDEFRRRWNVAQARLAKAPR